MPRVVEEIQSFNFTAGLVTESSELNFPENASLDEENFELLRNGARRRRQGVDYEANYVKKDITDSDNIERRHMNTYVWRSVAQDGDLEFLVVQEGDILHYHDLSAIGSNSSNKKSFTTNLATYKSTAATHAGNASCSFSVGLGKLVVVAETIEPIAIEYDADTDTITETQIDFKIRDFEGVDDGLDPSERPTTIDADHRYNLRNQGWPETSRNFNNAAGSSSTVGDPIDKTFEEVGFYPSNSDIFYFGKSTSADQTATIGAFNPYELQKLEIRVGFAPKGRFIINAFESNRSDVSGIGGLSEFTITERPSDTVFAFGRVWYALRDKIYFSQTIQNLGDFGKCHQKNDPTAEEVNALLDSDGGVIPFPDAGEITAITSTQDAVFIASSTGVWQIRGVEGNFKAGEFTVKKLVGVGVSSSRNMIEVESAAMFLSDSGIYALTEDRVAGGFTAQNITESSIQSFYLEINRDAIKNSKLIYDSTTRKVFMFYNSDSAYDGVNFINKYNSVLVFDTALGAFYKYSISALVSGSPYVYSAYISGSPLQFNETFEVTDSSLNNIIDSSTNNVQETISNSVLGSSNLQMLTIIPDGSDYDYTLSEFNNGTDFVDWKTEDGTGVAYNSFLETGYMVIDAARQKQATWLIAHLKRTETEFIDNGAGLPILSPASSCKVKAKWDWTTTSAANRWSSEQQVYRLNVPFLGGDIGDPFDYSYDVITTKSKIRGKGRSLHLRFESEAGKDCYLLGWSINITGNASP